MQKKTAKTKFFKLEYLRRKYHFKQSDFALLIGACNSSYSHKVNRISPFTYDEMKLIYDALNKAAMKAGDPVLTLDDIFLD